MSFRKRFLAPWIFTPSFQVPCGTLTVSPGFAALIAFWMVLKQPLDFLPFEQTLSVWNGPVGFAWIVPGSDGAG